MQSNSSASGPVAALSVCGGEEDEREIFKLVSPAGAASNLAAFNLSLNCWLHILSKESSMDLHGDSANLAVGFLSGLTPFLTNIQRNIYSLEMFLSPDFDFA